MIALIGVFALGIALEGYLFGRCTAIERAAFAVAGLMCVYAEPVTDIIGVAGILVLIYLHRRMYTIRKKTLEPL